METITWTTNSVHNIRPDEFYNLISRNAEHIEKTFPVTLSGCLTLEKTIGFIALAIAGQLRKDTFYYYLRDNETDTLIGYLCIKNINRSLGKCELAYFVDKDFEGRGIITRAVANALSVCFNRLGMNKVYICTSPENMASQKVALKHGFRQEGILRSEFKNGQGGLEDIFYFGLLKSDYTKNEK
jgi:ribosomal-protein-serine acetyltransferase